ncbi:hypothetical protein [Plantactinospora sp. CA-290183]
MPESVRAPFAAAVDEVDRRFETLTRDDGAAHLRRSWARGTS